MRHSRTEGSQLVSDHCYRFYLLQLLHPIGNNASCILHTRWGRVGENGQSQQKVCTLQAGMCVGFVADSVLQGPWPAATAVNEFKKQFKAKAGVSWEQRVGMVPAKGTSMRLLEVFCTDVLFVCRKIHVARSVHCLQHGCERAQL